MKLEMVGCPICGKPMPKKRLELGYPYCVNCSTEGRKVCLVEGTQEGDGTQSDIIIMTSQEARAINQYKAVGLKLDRIEDESSLNMQTFEEQEETEEILNRKDAFQLEGEFGYEISDRVAKDLETADMLGDEDLESDFIVSEEEED